MMNENREKRMFREPRFPRYFPTDKMLERQDLDVLTHTGKKIF